jgi:ABC-type cobalamin transport system permease subunit
VALSIPSSVASTSWNDKVSRQFVWLVGLPVTTFVAIVGALAAIVSAVLTRA